MSRYTCVRSECTNLVVRDVFVGGMHVASACAEHSEIRCEMRSRESVIVREPSEEKSRRDRGIS